MTIPFQSFPANWRVPLYWVEVDPTMAGSPQIEQPVLMVGQMLSSGDASKDIPIPVGSLAEAKKRFGEGSMLERMFNSLLDNNAAHDMWALPVADPAGGKATGTITVTHAPSDDGTIALYIAGQKLQVFVASDDTTATIASNIATAINKMGTLPVTAAVTVSGSNALTLTCKWTGASGNDIDMRDSYLGAIGGEVLPPSLTLSYTGLVTGGGSTGGVLTGGSGTPSFANGIIALSDESYEYVAMPYTDGTSITAWDAEYGFGDNGRWGWMRQAFGMVFTAKRSDYASLMTWGPLNNSPVISCMAFEQGSPSPVWEWTAGYAAKAARALLDDPARPLQTLTLAGILSAPKHARFSMSQINNLTSVGVATQRASSDGKTPMILRDTTMYQRNNYGQSDTAYELTTTLATLARVIRNQRSVITSKYPRHKLGNDGTRYAVGSAIVTPNTIKAELIAEYADDEYNGLVQNSDTFAENLIVERNSQDPNRLDVLYPPNLVNQLRIFAVLAQFRLRTQIRGATAA